MLLRNLILPILIAWNIPSTIIAGKNKQNQKILIKKTNPNQIGIHESLKNILQSEEIFNKELSIFQQKLNATAAQARQIDQSNGLCSLTMYIFNIIYTSKTAQSNHFDIQDPSLKNNLKRILLPNNIDESTPTIDPQKRTQFLEQIKTQYKIFFPNNSQQSAAVTKKISTIVPMLDIEAIMYLEESPYTIQILSQHCYAFLLSELNNLQPGLYKIHDIAMLLRKNMARQILICKSRNPQLVPYVSDIFHNAHSILSCLDPLEDVPYYIQKKEGTPLGAFNYILSILDNISEYKIRMDIQPINAKTTDCCTSCKTKHTFNTTIQNQV